MRQLTREFGESLGQRLHDIALARDESVVEATGFQRQTSSTSFGKRLSMVSWEASWDSQMAFQPGSSE